MISMELQTTVHIQHLNHGLSQLQSHQHQNLMQQHQLPSAEDKPKSKLFFSLKSKYRDRFLPRIPCIKNYSANEYAKYF